MTVQDILVKNKVFKEVGEDINFNLQLTRDCYIHTQRQIEKAMKEYARIKCQELLEIMTEKAMIETDNDCYGKMVVKSTYSTEREQGFSSTTTISVNRDSILNAVDLDSFCS